MSENVHDVDPWVFYDRSWRRLPRKMDAIEFAELVKTEQRPLALLEDSEETMRKNGDKYRYWYRGEEVSLKELTRVVNMPSEESR